MGDCSGVYSFGKISAIGLALEKLSRYSEVLFLIFFISDCLRVSASNIFRYLWFSFSQHVRVLSWFSSSIPLTFSFFRLFIISMTHFQCQIPFLYPGCIFLLFLSGSFVHFHFFLVNTFISSIFIFFFFYNFIST